MKCCAQDRTTWYSLVELLEVYPLLEKKGDRLILIEIIYLLIIFSFDFKGHLIYALNSAPVPHITSEIATFVSTIHAKLKNSDLAHKDSTTFALLLVCYSEFLPLSH